MNREHLIEAGQAVYIRHWRKDPESPSGECSCGNELDWGGRYSRHVVEAIVDAILPQVATVEELEALPNGSLLDHHGSVFRWRSNMSLLLDLHSSGLDYEPADILRNGPLTVVWTPT